MDNHVIAHSLFTNFDIELFKSGHHCQLYEKFGSHLIELENQTGCYFAVYAPSAKRVEVIGGFNYWKGEQYVLNVRWDGSGIWEGFIPNIKNGELYKYKIYSNHDDKIREKSDPYGKRFEMPPKTASIVHDYPYKWKDSKWMATRGDVNNLSAPISIYEMHVGSWKKDDQAYSLNYRALADELIPYLLELNYTHVELLPVMEHPFYPSWGYLCTGFFAPTSRFGQPEDFKYFVDALHKNNIGVILDWVPAHFPSDEYALADFDGSAVYEHPDQSKGFHPDWNSYIFNFERPEIRSFLISSAHFWCKHFHADGLRVDAVASMLYLDYSREEGQWSPNMYGGNEYLGAIQFIKELNKTLYNEFDDILMIAEESTAFNGVTQPVHVGGLGFGLKWMMGWMNDTLEYFSRDPIHRKYHHGEISRSLTYAFSENYLLPLSHDEVVHGKQSLINKMPGDEWQKFANLRLLYMLMYGHPGQKLLFMGQEFGHLDEWNVNESLNWQLLENKYHSGLKSLVSDLNKLYRTDESLFSKNYTPQGWEWIDYSDAENSVLSFIRHGSNSYSIFILNFSPVVRSSYRIGIPYRDQLVEQLNSDHPKYGGSGVSNDIINVEKITSHGREQSISITIPPLAGIILKSL